MNIFVYISGVLTITSIFFYLVFFNYNFLQVDAWVSKQNGDEEKWLYYKKLDTIKPFFLFLAIFFTINFTMSIIITSAVNCSH